MEYSDLQKECANAGFIDTPMTIEQFKLCRDMNLTIGDCYNICCDLNSGFDFGNLLASYYFPIVD